MGKNMLKGFKIDNRIYYSIEQRTIMSLESGGNILALRPTKARLLEYLLMRVEEDTISDRDLLIDVWDKYGLSSSSSRLWLVMQELRTIFSSFNVDDSLLIRVES